MEGSIKETGTKSSYLVKSQKVLYDRVRIVTIECEGSMSCSCGKYKCVWYRVHMCVLSFIRWNTIYYQCSTFGCTRFMTNFMVALLHQKFQQIWVCLLTILLIGSKRIILEQVIHTRDFLSKTLYS